MGRGLGAGGSLPGRGPRKRVADDLRPLAKDSAHLTAQAGHRAGAKRAGRHAQRSQIDVTIKGSTEQLLEEMKGFHWMTCYGDYLRESGYALKKVGVDWCSVTPTKMA